MRIAAESQLCQANVSGQRSYPTDKADKAEKAEMQGAGIQGDQRTPSLTQADMGNSENLDSNNPADPVTAEARKILLEVDGINAPSILAAKKSLEMTGEVPSDQLEILRANLSIWRARNGNGVATR